MNNRIKKEDVYHDSGVTYKVMFNSLSESMKALIQDHLDARNKIHDLEQVLQVYKKGRI